MNLTPRDAAPAAPGHRQKLLATIAESDEDSSQRAISSLISPDSSLYFSWQFYWDLAVQADFILYKELALGIKGEAFNLTDTETQLSGSTSTNPALYGKATSRNQFAGPRAFRLTALLTF